MLKNPEMSVVFVALNGGPLFNLFKVKIPTTAIAII